MVATFMFYSLKKLTDVFLVYHSYSKQICVTPFVVGDAPKLLSGVTDVTVISPEVATLECSVKPGTKDVEIRWYELIPFLNIGALFIC